MTSKRINFYHIVNSIVIHLRCVYSNGFLCYVWYSIPNIEYLITDLLFENSKVIVSLPVDVKKNIFIAKF